MNNFTIQSFGKWLIIAGILGFVTTSIISFTSYTGIDHGTLAAISFLILIIGVAFHFPSLLEENPGELSTTRIVVLIITLVFSLICIKIGWTAGSFEQFKIDPTWVYILGLAFGSKVFQKFGENERNKKDEVGK